MNYTNRMKVNGELACRGLSEKAARYYNETEPLTVYEYEVWNEETEEDETFYTIKEGIGGGHYIEGLTFEELNKWMEENWDAFEECEE